MDCELFKIYVVSSNKCNRPYKIIPNMLYGCYIFIAIQGLMSLKWL
jgi:hypothetical protein